jgi:hypothetical protein
MIDQSESEQIYTNAYVPEHLADYVTAVSGAEPFLFEQFLCYKRDEALIFIGYPLGTSFNQRQMEASLEAAVNSMKPRIISLVTPSKDTHHNNIIQQSSDWYYRLELDGFVVPREVRAMIRRASREISIERGRNWSEEHDELIAEFLAKRQVSEETQYIFNRLPGYLASATTALLLSARNQRGELIALDVADYGSKDYAFYMFNFASREHYVPGASDLLLNELVTIAQQKGKRFINLGLAINAGVTFFKQKWGGLAFLNHEFVLYEKMRTGIIESILGRM